MSEEPFSNEQGRAPDQLFAPGAPFALNQPLPVISTQRPQASRGRRSHTTASQQGGHYLKAIVPQGSVRDIALDATLRAAALRQAGNGAGVQGREGAEENQGASAQKLIKSTASSGMSWLPPSNSAQRGEDQLTSHPLATEGRNEGGPSDKRGIVVKPADLRVKVRRARTGNLILFVVDASGSMGARKRMVAVKGAIFSLLLDAYQKRDRVGLITFRGSGANVLVPPTNSVELAERHLRQLPTGGRTPLAAGLQLAEQLLATYLQRDAALAPLLVLVTDGRANVGQPTHIRQIAVTLAQKQISALVLDSEQGFVRMGKARELAGWLDAEYMLLDQLRAERIAGQIKQRISGASLVRQG